MIMATNGLQGVVAADTAISFIDGEKGQLVYRGHVASSLAISYSFEEVAHLLWFGCLPDGEKLAATKEAFQAGRSLPEHVIEVIHALPRTADMMSVLRTAVSAMDAHQWPSNADEAIRFTAAIPAIICTRHAALTDRPIPTADPALGHVANYLQMLFGQPPKPEHARALEGYLIMAMEHGMNASTFAGRVVSSTESDLASALTASLGAMKGPLHGGAPSEVLDMLAQIGSVENAEAWITRELESGHKLMGFGHRVYKTKDPRGQALKTIVTGLAGQDSWFMMTAQVEDIAERLLAKYKPNRRLHSNVEYWAAAILNAINLPKALFTPTFSIGRVVGWTAHVLEQSANNRIIRPESRYIGNMPEAYADQTV